MQACERASWRTAYFLSLILWKEINETRRNQTEQKNKYCFKYSSEEGPIKMCCSRVLVLSYQL